MGRQSNLILLFLPFFAFRHKKIFFFTFIDLYPPLSTFIELEPP